MTITDFSLTSLYKENGISGRIIDRKLPGKRLLRWFEVMENEQKATLLLQDDDATYREKKFSPKSEPGSQNEKPINLLELSSIHMLQLKRIPDSNEFLRWIWLWRRSCLWNALLRWWEYDWLFWRDHCDNRCEYAEPMDISIVSDATNFWSRRNNRAKLKTKIEAKTRKNCRYHYFVCSGDHNFETPLISDFAPKAHVQVLTQRRIFNSPNYKTETE